MLTDWTWSTLTKKHCIWNAIGKEILFAFEALINTTRIYGNEVKGMLFKDVLAADCFVEEHYSPVY